MSHTRTFKVVRALLVQCLVCSTFFMPTLANAATEHDSEFDELLALNPGVSASELASALDAESSEKGMSVQEYARSSWLNSALRRRNTSPKCKICRSEEGARTWPLSTEQRVRRICFRNQTTSVIVYWSPGVPHYGHVGIFSGRDWIVEAGWKTWRVGTGTGCGM